MILNSDEFLDASTLEDGYIKLRRILSWRMTFIVTAIVSLSILFLFYLRVPTANTSGLLVVAMKVSGFILAILFPAYVSVRTQIRATFAFLMCYLIFAAVFVLLSRGPIFLSTTNAFIEGGIVFVKLSVLGFLFSIFLHSVILLCSKGIEWELKKKSILALLKY